MSPDHLNRLRARGIPVSVESRRYPPLPDRDGPQEGKYALGVEVEQFGGPPKLCEDEGCPHFGEVHVCVDVVASGMTLGTVTLDRDEPELEELSDEVVDALFARWAREEKDREVCAERGILWVGNEPIGYYRRVHIWRLHVGYRGRIRGHEAFFLTKSALERWADRVCRG